MDEKQPIKIKLSTVILIFIILILIFVIIGMYMYYNNDNTNPNAVSSTNSLQSAANSNKSNTGETAKLTELNIGSDQITKLYKYIPALDSDLIEKNAYQSTKITMNNLTSDYLLKNAFKNLELKDSDKKTFDSSTTDVSDMYRFDASLLQSKVKEMYGTNIDNQDFRISASEQCGYENGEYVYSVGGASSEDIRNIRKIQKAYSDDESLYIEDSYLCLKIVDNDDSSYAKLFISSDSSNSLFDLDNLNELYSMNNDKLSSYICNKYGSSMASYKHTFKKASDDSYYWYSTEPVK